MWINLILFKKWMFKIVHQVKRTTKHSNIWDAKHAEEGHIELSFGYHQSLRSKPQQHTLMFNIFWCPLDSQLLNNAILNIISEAIDNQWPDKSTIDIKNFEKCIDLKPGDQIPEFAVYSKMLELDTENCRRFDF